ncbi:SHOCT domain-containing protein [Dolichospermum sp. ST_con]|nr:SHOCT domain-containing protein [Dolichospermum sp. ST_con]MDD1419824.1 SHOCT domain-containing protein [Dolichospermum sp. ST_sed1]MDD1425901.1 SHOCT domain-containing protein [Dolichospermum sp. ST_sed9]MDD1430933.1 SHOCT domain-containing protein [Dolichospermum sp. ST_sed6]MDD1441454.1 SHOCT domain-containing protein [Dolichospermum sp. ST_sed3]MDD1446221.1 SHOCT domain-containing protein [Dolichospermum sp. ST_sed8]MDD1453711.1 SHOCT domain-containing protein [Dolichospermum sp. ST_se
MTSRKKSGSNSPKTPEIGSILFYYLVGAGLIAFALIGASALGNPLIVTGVIVVVSACMIFISTPTGRTFIAKYSAKYLVEEIVPAQKVISQEKLFQELAKKRLLAANEKIVFYQWATYQGGVAGHPKASTSYGMSVVLDKAFTFYDQQITIKIPYENIVEAKLENFQVGSIRGILGSGAVAVQLQLTQNILSIRYMDTKGVERNAKFQVNGSRTIPGEGERAREFLNYLLEFKGDFVSTSVAPDPGTQLEKLKALKDKGIISEAEFQAKKDKLLEQM